MNGPFVIVCRAHSGGRILSEAFIRSGVQMGIVREDTKDTRFFSIRKNDQIRYLTERAFEYPGLEHSEKASNVSLLKSCIENFIASNQIDCTKPFGWKFGESLFISPIILDAYPTAKIIHLIRDGRDVMLSRINARFSDKLLEPFNRLIVEGPNSMYNTLGLDFNKENVEKHRTAFEFMHWVTCIEFSRSFLSKRANYLEVYYEDLCTKPMDTLMKVFEFINMNPPDSVIQMLSQNISNNRIGKWKNLDQAQVNKITEMRLNTLCDHNYN